MPHIDPLPSADPLEIFWDALLSRKPAQIRSVFQPLDPQTRQAVIAHLKKMSTEEGWHPEQRRSAQAALKALRDLL